MTEEQTYPIYSFSLTLDDLGWSGASDHMLKDTSLTTIEEAFQQYLNADLDQEHPSLPDGSIRVALARGTFQVLEMGIKYLRHDIWCGDWFSHYTYNTHLSDEELLESFERFIRGKEPFAMRDTDKIEYYNERVPEEKRCCLMGAEDRWRWEGPCRCEHCTKKGIVRIDH